MPRIDLDVNFPILIIVLSILLIAVVEGGRISELVYHKSGSVGRVFFSFVFLIGGIFIIFGLLTAPAAFRKVAYVTMTVGVLIVLANAIGYFADGKLDSFAFSEVISGILIIAGGILLVLTNKESIFS